MFYPKISLHFIVLPTIGAQDSFLGYWGHTSTQRHLKLGETTTINYMEKKKTDTLKINYYIYLLFVLSLCIINCSFGLLRIAFPLRYQSVLYQAVGIFLLHILTL